MRVDFEQLFRAVPKAVMVLDRELRFVAANDAYLAITATASLADLLGRNVIETFPHDPLDPNNASAQRVRESFERVLATGEPDSLPHVVYKVPVHTAEGVVVKERTWSATHTPLFDEVGRTVGVMQLTEDITELEALRSPASRSVPSAAASVMQRAESVQAQNRILDVERTMLRQLLEQAPVFAVFLRGPEHVVELVNTAYLQLVGHRDVVGLAIRVALPELEGQGFFELLDRVYTTADPFVGRGLPITLQRTPGAAPEPRIVDFTYQPIIEPDGRVSGIFAIGSDTTEQHAAARSRQQLATIVEQSSDFIAAANLDGTIAFVNEGGRQMMGVGDRDVSTINPLEFFLEEDRELVTSTITQTIIERGRWHGELRMRHVGTGEAIPVDYNVFALKDATGATNGVASVTRDLRERKAAEQERTFLADAIPVQVWIANAKGALTYVNELVASYFGVAATVVLAEGWLDYLHADDVQPCIARWTSSLATGAPYSMEFRLRASTGDYRWHVARAHALRDADGVIVKWYGTNADIDDHRRGVEERERLISALAASNRELERFAYVASHDLKTPLRGIGNLAQWIEEDAAAALSPVSKEHLALMRGRVARMDALIDGVLRYSRSMKPDDHVQEVDVRDLIDVVVDLLAVPAGVKIVVEDGMPILHTLYVPLQQVFLNLIGNAVKHAGREDVEVRVSAREDGGAFYVFSVSDNGPGISPEHHQRIWGLFQTLDAAPRSAGIGLSVVKRLVELQDGTVSVERGESGGTTFKFCWPKQAVPTTPVGGTPVVVR